MSEAIVREALVLAGGLATRLGEASADVPKCLQPVAGRPFIDHIIWNLRRQGVRRVVLCTGRLHDSVEAHVGDGSDLGVEAVYAREPEPLGTAGAVALGARHLVGELAFVCNGDSLFDVNQLDLALRLRRDADARAVVALRTVPNAGRYGSVSLGADGRVDAFSEKGATGPGLINGGLYCVRSDWLASLRTVHSSLERDVFPAMAVAGVLAGVQYDGFFTDIGTPESLEDAQGAVAAWRHKPCAFLDRDGTINVDGAYVHSPPEFRYTPGMPGAIKLLNDAGWLVIVITNQAGIGRGLYTEDEFLQFTRWIDEHLAESGAHVDATYHCPHHPTAGLGEYLRECECRKPAPGMLLRAIADWEPDLARSFMMGDMPKDMEAAKAAGVRGVPYRGGNAADLVAGLIA